MLLASIWDFLIEIKMSLKDHVDTFCQQLARLKDTIYFVGDVKFLKNFSKISFLSFKPRALHLVLTMDYSFMKIPLEEILIKDF